MLFFWINYIYIYLSWPPKKNDSSTILLIVKFFVSLNLLFSHVHNRTTQKQVAKVSSCFQLNWVGVGGLINWTQFCHVHNALFQVYIGQVIDWFQCSMFLPSAQSHVCVLLISCKGCFSLTLPLQCQLTLKMSIIPSFTTLIF